jgi:pilus assembly protein Flp/PilA
MKRRISSLLQDQRGATAIEYGLIISLVVIAMMASLMQVANVTVGMWNGVSDKVVESNRPRDGA